MLEENKTIPHVSSRSEFPVRILTGALIFAIFIAAAYGWNVWYLHSRSENLNKAYMSLTKNIERILYLDEMLTMAAKMAASSKDLQYEKKYDQYQPELDGLLKETVRLMETFDAGDQVRVTERANRQLVLMERKAFEAVHQGHTAQALELLSSVKYLDQKALYANGIKATLDTLKAAQDNSRFQQRNERFLMLYMGIFAILLIFLSWIFSIGAARRWSRERKKHEEVLKESETRYQLISRAANDAIWDWNLQSNQLVWNEGVRILFGYGNDEGTMGPDWRLERIHPEDKERVAQGIEEVIRNGKKTWSDEYRFLCKSGAYSIVIDRAYVIHDPAGKAIRLVGAMMDVSQRKDMELEYRKLSLAVEQSPNMVVITDPRGNIEYVNPKFTEVTGYLPEEVLGKNPRLLKSPEISSDEFKELWDTINAGGEWRGEFRNRKKNGELYWELSSISPIKDANGVITHFLAIKEDVTKRKWAEETIIHMAYYDLLTDLPNRTLFNDRMNQAIAQAKRKKQIVAILILGLDRFKNINDTLGHAIGDLLLQAVAKRLAGCVREGDTVARLGGDEFMILLTGSSGIDEVTKVAERITETFKPSFNLEHQELHITVSIGISIYPYDGEDIETLVKNADSALSRAKEKGRNNYQLYAPTMNAKAFERMVLENSMLKALEREEFIINYQPEVDLKSGEIIGMEALVRWKHPDLGLISPAEFIPMAEENGLIIPIGEWVMRTACARNRNWQKAGYPPIRVAVNLSTRQFQQVNLPEMVSWVLNETGMEAQYLELEITESIAMQNVEYTIAVLRDLKEMGVRIAIDDFGTGYSSLSYLKQFPIDILKIDRSFVRDLATDPNDAAIADAIIVLAHSLKLKVTAEGVETPEQLEYLKQKQCDQVQGYLFSRPLSSEAFEQLLIQGARL